jgi:hypothetical protein
MVEFVLIELIAVPAEQSRGRHNPRAVKRKMSGFPTKARAAPALRGRIPYAERIQIVAPKPDAVTAPAGVPPGDGPKAGPKCTLRPAREAVWRAHIRSWQKSGLSRPAYCQSRGLALRTFNTWAARLRETFRHPTKPIRA